MTDSNLTSNQWTSVQAYTLSVICLMLGISGGWFIRGSQGPITGAPPDSVAAAVAGSGGQAKPSPEQMKQMSDTQAIPLLEKLKSDPKNADLLAEIGNVY